VDARGRWLIGGLAVALVALLVAIALVVTSRGSGDDELAATQREVGRAARTEAVAFLTVDHDDMEPLVDAVLAGATGDFAEQYASQRDTLVSEAVRTEATSTAEVVALGVGDLDEDSATVLVAANSTVTNTRTGPDGQVRYYRLRLDLVREDGRWLTSGVRFVR
jgi:Mce-associated membrane protein